MQNKKTKKNLKAKFSKTKEIKLKNQYKVFKIKIKKKEKN